MSQEKTALDFMVVPEQLASLTYVPNAIKIKFIFEGHHDRSISVESAGNIHITGCPYCGMIYTFYIISLP